MRLHVITALFCLLIVLYAVPTWAETDVGLTLGPLIGSHDEGNGGKQVAPVPIPILELRQRSGSFEIFLESLPIAPPITQSNGTPDQSSTSLTFRQDGFDCVPTGPSNSTYSGSRIRHGVRADASSRRI